MSLFEKGKTETNFTEVPETVVYNLLLEGKSVTDIFKELGTVDINFIINVKKKAKTLESQVNKYMSGSVQLKPAEADEEGKVVKEAVCYKPSTEEDLVKQLNSSLDVPVVVKDIIKCSSFTKEINWEEYKASFIGE